MEIDDLEKMMEKAKDAAKQWDDFEDDLKDIVQKKGYDLRAITPALPCIYAQMCDSLEMPFEDAVAFALKAISKIYGVEMVKVSEEREDINEAEFHSGSNTHH